MEIRPARLDEIDVLHGIVQRAYEMYVSRIGRRPAPMDDDYTALVKSGHVNVAVVCDEPVGLIVEVPQADHLIVENVAVDPAQQGRGIGRALLAHADRAAAQSGLGELRLYTNAAMTENLALYPRLGYRETHRRHEGGFDRVFFSKPTPPEA
jgi:ribosomal protein S18 acetylase RimI-like enzyme